MRFVLYTDKTVPQCLTAINERMHAKATSTRPALDGWVEKGGAFALSVSVPVMGRFARRTILKGQIEREDGATVIRGAVPGGVPRQGQVLIFVALALVSLTLIGSGNLLVGLLLLSMAVVLYIPMQGDFLNSEVLVDEVEKTLKAKPAPPKPLSKSLTSAARTTKPKAAPAKAGAPARAGTSTKSAAARPKPAKAGTPARAGTPAKTAKPAAETASPGTTAPLVAPTLVAASSPAASTPKQSPPPSPPPESEFPVFPDEPPP